MTVDFHTTVIDAGPSPLGLIPRRFVVRHCRSLCLAKVATAELADHARSHERPGSGQEGGAID